jgi:hypothetical protein
MINKIFVLDLSNYLAYCALRLQKSEPPFLLFASEARKKDAKTGFD